MLARTIVAIDVLNLLRGLVQVQPGGIILVGFGVAEDGKVSTLQHIGREHILLFFEFALVGRFDVLPVHVFCAHGDFLVAVVEGDMNGGAMARTKFHALRHHCRIDVLFHIGLELGCRVDPRLHRVLVVHGELHLQYIGLQLRGHGQGVEHELLADARAFAIGVRNPGFRIFALVIPHGVCAIYIVQFFLVGALCQGLNASRSLPPLVHGEHILQRHIADNGTRISTFGRGGKAADIHYHAGHGQTMLEVEAGHRTASLGQFLVVVGQKQVVVNYVDTVGMVYGGVGLEGIAKRTVIYIYAHLIARCARFVAEAHIPVEHLLGWLLGNAVADEGVGILGIAPIDTAGQAGRRLFSFAFAVIAIPSARGLSLSYLIVIDDTFVGKGRNGQVGALYGGQHHLVLVLECATAHVTLLVQCWCARSHSALYLGLNTSKGHGIASVRRERIVLGTGSTEEGKEYEGDMEEVFHGMLCC